METPVVYIVFHRILSLDGSELTVGGVQTYLMNLAQVIQEMGWKPIIVQKGNEDFEKQIQGITIRGRQHSGHDFSLSHIYKRIESEVRQGQDIVIWGTFQKSPNVSNQKTVAIQHGIGFDLVYDAHYFTNPILRTAFHLGAGRHYKTLQRRQAQSWFNHHGHKVCVDYNFVNWHRTYSMRDDDADITVIPNFTTIPDFELSPKSEFRRIVFARRFSFERGTLLMLDAAERLLQTYPNISITFAGQGELESKIKSFQARFPDQIELTKYDATDSIEFHRQFDIAIVPSIGSEGTSLSALEAMAAGCVLVCSNVGGLTNIVIDQFNGLLVSPLKQQLIEAISSVVDSAEMGNRLRTNARATVEQAFSREKWAERWVKVLKSL